MESSTDTIEAAPAPTLAAQSVDAMIVSVYDQVKRMFHHKVNSGNVRVLLTKTMSIVERFSGATGPEKKDVVLAVVENLIEELPIDESVQDAIKTSVHLLAPSIIDSVVSAAKGQLNIGGPGAPNGSCLESCFPCFG